MPEILFMANAKNFARGTTENKMLMLETCTCSREHNAIENIP